MTLYTHVEAQPESLHELASYFKNMSYQSADAEGMAIAARTSSQPWEGEAAEGFRAVAGIMQRDGAELEMAYRSAGDIVDRHAEDMTVVHRRMQDARGAGTKAGLEVTPTEIHDPGPAPPKPTFSPGEGYGGTATGASTPEEHQMLAAYSDWADKAAVYAQCATMVAEARTIEQESQNWVLDAIEKVVTNPIVQGSDLLTGLAAGFLSRQTNLRTVASSFTKLATQASDAAADTTVSSASRARNLMLSCFAEARSDLAGAAARTSTIATWLEKLPTKVQQALTMKIGRSYPANKPYISRAPIVFKKIPVLGTAFSGAAVAVDAWQGKDVTRSVVTNGSGLLSGVGVGALIGGPWGALGAFIVGTGVSIVSGEMYDAVVPQEEDSYPLAPGPQSPNALDMHNPGGP